MHSDEKEGQALYDDIAQEYKGFRDNFRPSPYKILEFPTILGFIKDWNLKFNSLLDVGCGFGDTLNYFHKRGAKVVGIDISSQMIKLAHKRHRQIAPHLSVASATRLPFQDAVIDGVVSIEVFHYLSLENTQKSFSEIYRVLRPGGFFAFVVTHPGRIAQKAEIDYFSKGKVELAWSALDKKVIHYHRPLDKWIKQIKRAGFLFKTIKEPMPSRKMTRQRPSCAKYRKHFYRLGILAIKN